MSQRNKDKSRDQKSLRICVMGAGYVGLVSAAGLAHLGHRVICCDLDARRIAQLNAGEMPLYEPDLEALMIEGKESGCLAFSGNCATAIGKCEMVVIAVGTPMDENGRADLSQVFGAIEMISDAAQGPLLVLIKSTVAIGTGDRLARQMADRTGPDKIEIISNPEFFREGAAVEDFLHPDRIVFGVADQKHNDTLAALYRGLSDSPPLLFTSRASAEMIKYASNSFLAIKVSFINEIADICEQLNADVGDVARGVGLDARIGEQFLHAGPGFGGSCFPKDMEALLESAARAGVHSKLVAASVQANTERAGRIVARIRDFCGGRLSSQTIGVLGLTFKADTNDIRASPAMEICVKLLARGASLRAYDPKGMAGAKPELPGAVFCKNAYACASGSDVLVLATDWGEFSRLDLQKLGANMTRKRLLDLRNLFSPEEARKAGFDYRSIGRADEKTIN